MKLCVARQSKRQEPQPCGYEDGAEAYTLTLCSKRCKLNLTIQIPVFHYHIVSTTLSPNAANHLSQRQDVCTFVKVPKSLSGGQGDLRLGSQWAICRYRCLSMVFLVLSSSCSFANSRSGLSGL